VSKSKPDLSPLLPDDATLKARRAELVDAVSAGDQGPQRAPGWRRRVPRLALGAATAVAVIAAVLIFRAGGDPTPAAFAVEPQAGGGVTIKVYSLEDASGVEDALEDAGIPAQVTWLPPGMTCDETRFTPSIAKLPGGGSLGGAVMAGPGTLTISVAQSQRARRESVANINLDPAAFRADQSVVLFGSPKPFGGDPEGGFEAHFQVAEGGLATIISGLPHDVSRISVKQPDHCLAIQMTLGRTAHGQQKHGAAGVVNGDVGSIGIRDVEVAADYLGHATGREQQAQGADGYKAAIRTPASARYYRERMAVFHDRREVKPV